MDAGNRLHDAAIPIAEANPIDMLHASDVGTAVLGNPDRFFAVQDTGHAGDPQKLVFQLLIDKLMDVQQLCQDIGRVHVRAGHQFQQSFRIIGRDLRVTQRGPECSRMWRLGNAARSGNA